MASSATVLFLFLFLFAFELNRQATYASEFGGDNEFAEFDVDDEPMEAMEEDNNKGAMNTPPKAKSSPPASESNKDGGRSAAPKDGRSHSSESKTNHNGGEEFSFLADDEDFKESAKSDEQTDDDAKGTDESTDEAAKPPKPLTFAEVPSHFRSNWSSYQVEMLALLIVFVYSLNYIYGQSKNHAIAYKWFSDNRERLEKQFSLVGDDGTSQENMGGCLIREADCQYSVWCTGRVGCRGMHSQIKLCKRQDLLGIVIRPRADRVIHKIDLDREEMDTFVIVFGQRKSVQKLVKEMHDLSAYVSERKTLDKMQLPNSFCVFAEIAETIPAIIDASTLQFLKKCEKYVEYIHLSDQYAGAKQQDYQYVRLPETHPTLVFSYFISDDQDDGDIDAIGMIDATLLNFTFFMLDKIRRYRLSKEGKAKADKKRQNLQENFLKLTHQQRQEAAQKRREEKTRERKQRVMEEEDPDRQKRLEKMEMKRDAKQRQPKMKQFKIK